MSEFTSLSADEIERRRLASVEAWRQIKNDRFDQWYQER